MPSIYQFSEIEMLGFFMVLVRASAFIVSWPVFGSQSISAPVKILFAFSLALALFPTVDFTQVNASLFSNQIVWLTIKEAFVGLSLGFLARLFFFAVSIAGDIMSVSMGISSAQLFNPTLGTRSTATEQFLVILASLFFLAIQGHHLLLSALSQSFSLFPLEQMYVNLNAFSSFGELLQIVAEIGLKMTAPILVAVLFMNLALAVMGRAVPQINVLITSLPVNVLLGLGVLIFSLPLMMASLHDLLGLTTENLFKILRAF